MTSIVNHITRTPTFRVMDTPSKAWQSRSRPHGSMSCQGASNAPRACWPSWRDKALTKRVKAAATRIRAPSRVISIRPAEPGGFRRGGDRDELNRHERPTRSSSPATVTWKACSSYAVPARYLGHRSARKCRLIFPRSAEAKFQPGQAGDQPRRDQCLHSWEADRDASGSVEADWRLHAAWTEATARGPRAHEGDSLEHGSMVQVRVARWRRWGCSSLYPTDRQPRPKPVSKSQANLIAALIPSQEHRGLHAEMGEHETLCVHGITASCRWTKT